MKLKSAISIFAATALGFATLSTLADNGNEVFNIQQKQAINKQIKSYLLSHPEILISMSQKLRAKQMEKAQQAALSYLKGNSQKIFFGKYTPVVGDPNGKVTLVEFFDYQCSICHEVFPFVKKIIKNNPKLRVVFRNFPIFGPASKYAAKAAIASMAQGKYLAFHNALFNLKKMEGKLTDQDVIAAAKQVGLNIDELKQQMKNVNIAKEIQGNYALAQGLALRGTPAFIIAPTQLNGQMDKVTFIPGASPEAYLQKAIDKAAQ